MGERGVRARTYHLRISSIQEERTERGTTMRCGPLSPRSTRSVSSNVMVCSVLPRPCARPQRHEPHNQSARELAAVGSIERLDRADRARARAIRFGGGAPTPIEGSGLDTDTVQWTVKTLLSRLVTLERIQFSRQLFTDVECPCRALTRGSADRDGTPLERR
eukprot:8570700-Pyramimonas_sp.AAC.1